MVNILTLALTHVLMGIAAWRLLPRDSLDDDAAADEHEERRPWLKGRQERQEAGGDA